MRASFVCCAILVLALAAPETGRAGETYGLGRPATSAEIAGWDIDVSPDGSGLPPGQGSALEGKAIFEGKCAFCHGTRGEGKPMDQLVGAIGSMNDVKPRKTVGSFWPYATTLFDYVHRAMPFNAPQSLTSDEVYAVCAYILFLNKIIAEDAVLNAKTLPQIKMPYADHFVSAYPQATPKVGP